MKTEFLYVFQLLMYTMISIYVVWLAKIITLNSPVVGLFRFIYHKHLLLALETIKFIKNRSRRHLSMPQFISLFFMNALTLYVVNIFLLEHYEVSPSGQQVSLWILIVNICFSFVCYTNIKNLEVKSFFESSSMCTFKLLTLHILSYSLYVENIILNKILTLLYFSYSVKVAFQYVLRSRKVFSEIILFANLLYAVSLMSVLIHSYFGENNMDFNLGNVPFFLMVFFAVSLSVFLIERQRFDLNEMEKKRVIFGADFYMYIMLIFLRLILWMI